ncbi:hypothetical protein FKM82_027990 [Ascaphus truei]
MLVPLVIWRLPPPETWPNSSDIRLQCSASGSLPKQCSPHRAGSDEQSSGSVDPLPQGANRHNSRHSTDVPLLPCARRQP